MGKLPKIAMTTLFASLLLTGVVLTLNLTAAQAAPEKPTVEWERTYGGPDDDWAGSVVQTSDGGFALAGLTRSYGAGEDDFWLVKISGKGPVQYTPTTSVNPSEGGSITLDPSGRTYKKGTKIKVTAKPAEAYEFDHWSGDISGDQKFDDEIAVIMDSDRSLTAHFKPTGEPPVGKPRRGIPLVPIIGGVVAAITIGIGIMAYVRRK